MDGINIIYSLGFKTNLAVHPITYYINEKSDSDSLVLSMIDELLKPKYKHTTFYYDNLSDYDLVFIVKVLIDYEDKQGEKYKMSSTFIYEKNNKINCNW